MTTGTKLIPSSSQTVGPYFMIGLEYLIGQIPKMESPSSDNVTIHGRVLDLDRTPIPDAMLEFWSSAVPTKASVPNLDGSPFPTGFSRVATDSNGNFTVVIPKPAPLPLRDGSIQAPHFLVLVFARGLLRHLISIVYFEDEPDNAADPVLLDTPAERRATLMARLSGKDSSSYRWDVVLQGQDETVFFAW